MRTYKLLGSLIILSKLLGSLIILSLISGCSETAPDSKGVGAAETAKQPVTSSHIFSKAPNAKNNTWKAAEVVTDANGNIY